jgi:hypothetical protein
MSTTTAVAKSKKITLASKLDRIVTTGGSWDEMCKKANTAAKLLKCTTKFNIGVLRAHVNYRIVTQNKVTFLGDKKIVTDGIQ